MYDVIEKETGKIWTVYGVKDDANGAYFLLFNDYWFWSESEHFNPAGY